MLYFIRIDSANALMTGIVGHKQQQFSYFVGQMLIHSMKWQRCRESVKQKKNTNSKLPGAYTLVTYEASRFHSFSVFVAHHIFFASNQLSRVLKFSMLSKTKTKTVNKLLLRKARIIGSWRWDLLNITNWTKFCWHKLALLMYSLNW